MMKELVGSKSEFISELRSNILLELNDDRLSEIEMLENQILAMQESVMQLHKNSRTGIISHADYDKGITQAEREITALRQKKANIELRNEQVKLTKYRIEYIDELLSGGLFLEGFSEQLFNDLIENIIIRKDKYEFHYKCGLEISYSIT